MTNAGRASFAERTAVVVRLVLDVLGSLARAADVIAGGSFGTRDSAQERRADEAHRRRRDYRP
jgi:hypothetical protein